MHTHAHSQRHVHANTQRFKLELSRQTNKIVDEDEKENKNAFDINSFDV